MVLNDMRDFLITSVIASLVLTLALNLLPVLFPNTAAKAERKIAEKMLETHNDSLDPNSPKVRVFFPWKAMLIISIILTIAVNIIGFIAR